MGKFIDRQKLEAHFSPAITGKDAYTAGEVLLSIQKFPSADVAPVIHAHWKWKLADNGWADTTCSNCGHVWNMDVHMYLDYDYCPYCGAKMDEEVETDEQTAKM